MNSRCSSRGFTAVVIGKRLILSAAMAVLTMVVIGSLWMIAVNDINSKKMDFHKRMVSGAIPIVAAADDITLRSDINKLIYGITGLDVERHLSNFGVLPYFCALNEAEAQAVSVSMPEIVLNQQSQQTAAPPKVSEQTNAADGLKIKNETTYNIDTNALLNLETKFNLAEGEPQILVVHTHGTESYTQSEKYHYSDTDSARCEDIRYNMIRVGEELTNELHNRGYNVLHDKGLNDYPSYNNSY
ncbi:MAG: stage II sporulation protein P, partial [Clostridia bacterium]|nr:stage II sporulation protein P [Clostridia bacterium]